LKAKAVGFDDAAVILLYFLYNLTASALSFPAGKLSDRVGRKNLLIVGGVSAFFEFFILIYAHGFWLFGISALIAGIGGACTSGAWNALLYDSLKADNKQEIFERVLGRMQAVD